MNYNSLFFLFAFPLIFILYTAVCKFYVGRHKVGVQNMLLLTISYIVLFHEDAMSSFWMIYVSVVTFAGARLIGRRQVLPVVVVALAVAPLAILKYNTFVCEMLEGLSLPCRGHSFIVPVGISFFTLQAIGYLVDVSRGKVHPESNFFDLALFLAFFPQIVAGPISRYSQLMPQIKRERPFSGWHAVQGLRMLLWGMFLKVVVADKLGIMVDDILGDAGTQDGGTLLSAFFCYSFQIYADFSGYSLMAIGTAKTMGFGLPDNFRRPYLSCSLTEFWRRWHISLSQWLRDYVYISLGGNRCSRMRRYLNIVVTFVVSGLWHGAHYTFVVWGLLNGMVLCLEKMLSLNENKSKNIFVMAVRTVVTFVLVTMLWVVFRMPSLGDACMVYSNIFSLHDWHVMLPEKYLLLFVMVVVAKDIANEYFPALHIMNNRHVAVRWCAYTLVAMSIILFGVFDSGQFIYARF